MSNAQRIPVALGASLLAIIGGSFGVLAAVTALTGDELGRVNLLFSLLLFALLPALLLLLTLALLTFGKRQGLLHGLLQLRLLPKQLSMPLTTLPSSALRQATLFLLSQVFAFTFAAGSLAGFGILLLATDVSFVWRSTLLEASDLYPLLTLIGTPWGFWPEAQASLAMLDTTQDFRLMAPSEANYVGQWWRYLLAAQLCYSLAPRLVMLCAGFFWLQRSQRRSMSKPAQLPKITASTRPAPSDLAPITTDAPQAAVIVDAAHTPAGLLNAIEKRLAPADISAFEPAQADQNFTDSTALILLVRSWEPPLGEVADFIALAPSNCEVFVAPLTWQGKSATPIGVAHSEEWRRFCAAAHCHYLQIGDVAHKETSDDSSE